MYTELPADHCVTRARCAERLAKAFLPSLEGWAPPGVQAEHVDGFIFNRFLKYAWACAGDFPPPAVNSWDSAACYFAVANPDGGQLVRDLSDEGFRVEVTCHWVASLLNNGIPRGLALLQIEAAVVSRSSKGHTYEVALLAAAGAALEAWAAASDTDIDGHPVEPVSQIGVALIARAVPAAA